MKAKCLQKLKWDQLEYLRLEINLHQGMVKKEQLEWHINKKICLLLKKE